MENGNSYVLNKIKEEFLLSMPKRNRNLKIPNGISFTPNSNAVIMHLSSIAVSSNMQKDDGAFEGWALILKRWGKYDKIILSWTKPLEEIIINGHYQRFLFRLKQFSKDFNAWFFVDEKCQILLNDLRIKEEGLYLLNLPSIPRKDKGVKNKPEALLEDEFVNGKYRERLQNITGAMELHRQLPVGVFNKSISKENSIFTGGGSAIDIWGINNSNELLVFELKEVANEKVGIISELYFYITVLQCLRNKKFKYENCNQLNRHLLRIPDTKKINAYFLARKLHPLIDIETIKTLNEATLPEVCFHFIQIEENYELSINSSN